VLTGSVDSLVTSVSTNKLTGSLNGINMMGDVHGLFFQSNTGSFSPGGGGRIFTRSSDYTSEITLLVSNSPNYENYQIDKWLVPISLGTLLYVRNANFYTFTLTTDGVGPVFTNTGSQTLYVRYYSQDFKFF